MIRILQRMFGRHRWTRRDDRAYAAAVARHTNQQWLNDRYFGDGGRP